MKKCEVDGCDNKHKAKGYCSKHYQNYMKNGTIKPAKIRKEPNEIVINENYAEIILYKNNKPFSKTAIDIEDVDKVKSIVWRLNDRGYVSGVVNRKKTHLSRFLMNPPVDMVVDHINDSLYGDKKIDNRKSNLRICTQKENSTNKERKK